jgi:hypothetical protein
MTVPVDLSQVAGTTVNANTVFMDESEAWVVCIDYKIRVPKNLVGQGQLLSANKIKNDPSSMRSGSTGQTLPEASNSPIDGSAAGKVEEFKATKTLLDISIKGLLSAFVLATIALWGFLEYQQKYSQEYAASSRATATSIAESRRALLKKD